MITLNKETVYAIHQSLDAVRILRKRLANAERHFANKSDRVDKVKAAWLKSFQSRIDELLLADKPSSLAVDNHEMQKLKKIFGDEIATKMVNRSKVIQKEPKL